ncbi:MAG: glycerol-3-phosphate acyltransferase [Ardenticatenaceae bacterium]|nr:glycerol-3-phosphate acyltransferase [Ardenticatenaceae bacterium]
MVNIVYLIIAGFIGYLFGSIPFGYIYVKAKTGQILTEVGSGRTGGTNSLRAAGKGVGILTSLSDVAKGFTALWLTRLLFTNVLNGEWLPWALAVAGVMSVVGHNWSLFLKFRGGAGTGPNVGWSTAIWFPMFPIAFLVMLAFYFGLGIASVASLAMGAIIPIIFAVRYITGVDATAAYLIGGLAAAAIVAWALRPNIKRLLRGEERVVGPQARRKQKKAEG